MKTICSTLIGIHYKEHLLPLVDDTPNLQHYYDTISNNIKTLFHKSLYLQGGLNENVSLVISYIFIYEMLTFFKARLVISPTRSSVTSAKNFIFKADCLAILFPDEFKSLPKKCLAMAATCVYLN